MDDRLVKVENKENEVSKRNKGSKEESKDEIIRNSGSPKSIKEDKKKAEDKSGSSETKADFESPVDDPA
jgi:hypothetical protein